MMSSPGSSPHSPLSLSVMNKKVQRLICNGVGVAIVGSTIAAAVALYHNGCQTVTPMHIRTIDVIEYRGTKLERP